MGARTPSSKGRTAFAAGATAVQGKWDMFGIARPLTGITLIYTGTGEGDDAAGSPSPGAATAYVDRGIGTPLISATEPSLAVEVDVSDFIAAVQPQGLYPPSMVVNGRRTNRCDSERLSTKFAHVWLAILWQTDEMSAKFCNIAHVRGATIEVRGQAIAHRLPTGCPCMRTVGINI